jgi:alanyl aminopeptidase
MTRALLFAFSVLTLAAAPPKLRLSEVEDFAPTSYRAELSLDPNKPDFTGTIHIKLDVKKPSQIIWLNANKIAIAEAILSAGGKSWTAKAQPSGEDFLALEFDSAIPAGAAELRIRYTGAIERGGSSAVFQTEDAGEHYLLTQFESTQARRAFPCFDEPSYKVPWQLTLHVPARDKAISNTPPVSEKSEGGVRTYVFKETKPLPSYLVAFGVGPFEFVDAGYAGRNRVPVRIVTPKGKAGEAAYAAQVTAAILTRLEEYFGIPFPYEKSDQVAVPVTNGFSAMENAGMVTYGQAAILAKPDADTILRQRSYASAAAHELAHQWFGDLVTMEWWDDIWLNEAFATWMEQKLIAEWKPEWKTRVQDVDSKLFAQGEDSLITARKIRQPIESKSDIENAFDGITYEKGAAVIGMFESWMGPAEFRKGVQSYLQRYAFRSATSGAFLDSLSSASRKDVTSSFSTFLNQAGVPVVSVALDCTGKTPTLHLEQERFLPLGSKGSVDQSWKLPVCIRYDGGGAGECTLMTGRRMDLALQKAPGCPAWVQANDQAKGYYRVDYKGGLFSALSSGKGASQLGAAERNDLLGNAQAMSDAGKLPVADALALVETFHNDSEHSVVDRAITLARTPSMDLVPEELMPNYRRFLLKNFQARAHELGWLPHPGESDDVRLLRPNLLALVAREGGDRELADQARELADRWLKDPAAVAPEVLHAILNTAAWYGDRALFDRMLAAFQKSRDRREKRQIISSMAYFRDPRAIEAALQAVLSGAIPLLDGNSLLVSAGQGWPATRHMAFEFIKAHFDQIMRDRPSIFGFDLGALLPRSGQLSCDEKSKQELQAFFGPIVERYTGAPRNLAQVVEAIDLCIAKKAEQSAGVAEFLRKY